MKGRKTGGRDWKPGQSGNPAGSAVSAVSLPNKLYKTLGTIEYRDLVTTLFFSKVSDWEKIESDAEEEGLRRLVCGILLRAYEKRCPITLEYLISRVLGKVRDVTPEDNDRDEKGPALLEEIRKVMNDPKYERKA